MSKTRRRRKQLPKHHKPPRERAAPVEAVAVQPADGLEQLLEMVPTADGDALEALLRFERLFHWCRQQAIGADEVVLWSFREPSYYAEVVTHASLEFGRPWGEAVVFERRPVEPSNAVS